VALHQRQLLGHDTFSITTQSDGEQLMSMIKEFQAFAMRGNMVDMAVGIVIGVAFGNIVSSMEIRDLLKHK